MDRFLELNTFVSVVEAGSFVRASEVLDLTKAATSRHLADLESRLGVRLLNRTTRKLSLTSEGQIFFERAKEILSLLSEAEAEITRRNGQASGLLRINAPVTFGLLHLAPIWGDFKNHYPNLEIELNLSDRIIDLVEEGVDVAIRIAELQSSTLISRRLASTRMILCASPDYLHKHSPPKTPIELKKHSIIAYSYWAGKDEWSFIGPQGLETVKTNPIFKTNSGDTCKALALASQGIILQPSFLVYEELKRGKLIEVMPAYRSIELGVYALYPSKKHISAKVVALIDFLIDHFKNSPFEL
jgi:DNA-binding transcriptional LysR family regulator